MQTKKLVTACVITLSLLLSSCGQSLFEPTPTPTLQPTTISTATLLPEEIIAEVVARVCESQPSTLLEVGTSPSARTGGVRLCPESDLQITLPEEWMAKTPEDLRFVVRFDEGTAQVGDCGPYISVSTQSGTYVSRLRRFVTLDLINVATGQVEDRTSVDGPIMECPGAIRGTSSLVGDPVPAQAIEQALTDLLSSSGSRTLSTHDRRAIIDITFSPDGKILASLNVYFGSSAPNASVIVLWNAVSHVPLSLERDSDVTGSAVRFSPDGKFLVSGAPGGLIKLWDVATLREVGSIQADVYGVSFLEFSPDGAILASQSNDHNSVKLWDVASGSELFTLEGHTSDVPSVAFSPDGKLLASGSFDKTVRLWEIPNGRKVAKFSGHTEAVISVAFSPDGKLVASGSLDNTVKVWSISSGIVYLTLEGHTDGVNSVVFSPDGKWLASGSEDGTVKLWDVATGREVRTFEGYSEGILSIAFSPDGKWLASGSSDGTVKLWPVDLP